MNKAQILSNIGQEFAKQAFGTKTVQGTSDTNWPLIIGVASILCLCCLSSSGLIGYLIYSNKKEPFEQSQDDEGVSSQYNLVLLLLLGLVILYFVYLYR